jgi:hypothetical protein
MTRLSITGGIIAALALSACHSGTPRMSAARPAPLTHFSLIVEHSQRGWAAHCETGCRWTELTMDCAGCAVRVSLAGVSPARNTEEDPAGFAFTLQGTPTDWAASGVRGVAWRSLTWQCEALVCRARIDETGVGGV